MKGYISHGARFCIVHPPIPEGTKILRTDPRVVDHTENEYRRAHVHRWGVSEIGQKRQIYPITKCHDSGFFVSYWVEESGVMLYQSKEEI